MSMGRLKNMIAARLQVFWLVALMSGPLALSASAKDGCDNSCPLAGNAAPLSESPDGSSAEFIRCEVRRINLNHQPVTPPRLAPVGAGNQVLRHHFVPAIPLTGESILLQQRWQFVWRTAGTPRSPSVPA